MPASNAPRAEINPQAEARRRRTNLIITLVAILCVLVPFLFWRQTWFGEPLTDQELSEYLADKGQPRHIQHALVQIAERIDRGDQTAKRWYPQVIALGDSPIVELRITLAWVLGRDNRSEQFHQTLLALLKDPDDLVRRNAALSLVRFGDSNGLDVIRQMLEPVLVVAPAAGTLRYRHKEGDALERGAVVARVEQADGREIEIQAPLPGILEKKTVPEGTTISAGQQIASLAPSEDHAWEALRALLLIGQPEDLPLVERFTRTDNPTSSDRIRRQAVLTASEIRQREAAIQPSEPRP